MSEKEEVQEVINPCFCGRKAKVRAGQLEGSLGIRHWVECECGIRTQAYKLGTENRAKAISAWNKIFKPKKKQ